MNPQLDGLVQDAEQEAIQSFLASLWARYPSRLFQAILFGSKARGDSHSDSDVDILLIVDEDDWRFRHAISDVAADVSLEYAVLIGSQAISQERWQRMGRERFSFYENVVRESIPLTVEPA